MKRKIKLLILILISLFASKGVNGQVKNDLVELKLKGKIKSFTVAEFKNVAKSIEVQKGDFVSKEKILFNETGYKIMSEKYKSNDSLNYSTKFKYDVKGNLIEAKKINPDGSFKYKTSYKFDESKKIEIDYYSKENVLESKITYKYNNKGKEIEYNYFNSVGKFNGKATKKYDDTGNEIEYCSFDSSNILSSKETYIYDNKGNQLEWAWYNGKGVLQKKETYKYDEKGNQIELYTNRSKDNNKMDDKFLFTYDDKGNCIEEKRYVYLFSKEGSLRNRNIFKYDGNGNVIEYIYVEEGVKDKKTEYKYEYDKVGNWIKKTIFDDALPKSIIERKIIYY